MDYFELKYDETISPLYKIFNDSLFSNNKDDNKLPHTYSIKDRIDMTFYDVYSIDPDGCEDADDAFSIFEENNKLFLAIHIADPTEYINLDSNVWNSIKNKVITQYPSNRKPIHMMPIDIMSKSSLIENKHGNIKNAITILTEIDNICFTPIHQIKLLFTKIKVKSSNSLSYFQASELYPSNTVLRYGINISRALLNLRSKKTIGTALNDLSHSYIKYFDNDLCFYQDSDGEKSMKKMIAEFAIFANSFIGEYLKINFEGKGLFRTCKANDWLENYYDLSGEDLLNEIIVNGIRAEYLSNVSSHDLVGSQEYCHFTSPIRRLSDCVCHYLIKYIYLRKDRTNLLAPFTNDELDYYSLICISSGKSIKNIQYKDNKFRIIQAISSILIKKKEIKLGYYIASYTGLFLNIIINYVNEHYIYLSYTLRIPNLLKQYQIKKQYFIDITKVNCMNKFDQGTIPELDNIFL